MRKKDREVTDRNEILEIMRGCDVCRLALNDPEGYPYILPLNFGMLLEGDKISLVFHSALEGYKVELMKADSRASFEMDREHKLQYFENQGRCTMAYESVMGRGRLRILGDDEKLAALKALMSHYHPDREAPFATGAVPRTLVYVLEVESLTGKRKLPK